MVGSHLVREFRARTLNQNIRRPRLSLKSSAVIAGTIASALAFGSIIVKAGDDSGIYDMVRVNSGPTRLFARTTPLPRIFVPSQQPMVRTSLSYAPVFESLVPAQQPGMDIKNLKKTSASPRSIKVTPKSSSEDFAEGYLNSKTSYCVRTCDGFFFPVGNPDSGDLGAHEATCERQCPTAETAIYVAPAGSKGIEDAVNRRGQRYDATQTAFNHRTQIDKACSCSGGGIGATKNYSVMTDFTLRDGDFVMSREGIKVFRDKGQFPYKSGAFAKVDSAKLSAAERKNLQSVEAASMRGIGTMPLSAGLRARISAQVESARPKTIAGNGVNTASIGTKRKIEGGKELRYVGPDLDYDRAR